MYKKLLLPILFLLAFTSSSQNFEWVATNPINFTMNPDLIGYNIASDPSGNIYMTGFKDNAYAYQDIMGTQYYIKYDAEANWVFTKEINGKVNIYNMETDSDGNVIMLLGYLENITFETLSLVSINQGVNHLMVKLDPLGNVLWYREFSIPDSFVSDARALTTDAVNNIYIGYDDFQHSYIEKISPSGTTLNTITQQNVNTITSLSIDSEGNLYAAGSCADQNATFGNTPAPLPSDMAYNTYITKYNPTGTFQWVKYLDNITCPSPEVKARTSEEIYITSELFDAYTFDNIVAEGPILGFSDVYIAKLNSSGNFQWVREVPGTGSLTSGKRNILSLDADGNVFLVGRTSDTINWSNTISTSTSGFSNGDAIVLKYNPSGEILMAKAFGGANEDRIDGIAIGTDGAILVTGLVTGNVNFDAIVHEAADNEKYSFVAKITNGTLDNPHSFTPSIFLYPNPASDHIYFANISENLQGSIFNTLGQKVKDFTTSSNHSIAVSELAKGTYFIKLDGSKALKFIKY